MMPVIEPAGLYQRPLRVSTMRLQSDGARAGFPRPIFFGKRGPLGGFEGSLYERPACRASATVAGVLWPDGPQRRSKPVSVCCGRPLPSRLRTAGVLVVGLRPTYAGSVPVGRTT